MRGHQEGTRGTLSLNQQAKCLVNGGGLGGGAPVGRLGEGLLWAGWSRTKSAQGGMDDRMGEKVIHT